MSIVIGYVASDGVYVAADYQVTSDDGHRDYEANKIFEGDGYLLGVAGDYKIVNLIEHFSFKLPKKNISKFIVTELPLLIKDYLEPYRNENDDDGGDEYSIIVACDRSLYEINENHEASAVPFFHAIGTGAPYAFGAYHAMLFSPQEDPETILTLAVGAAIRYNAYCGGGMAIEKLPD